MSIEPGRERRLAVDMFNHVWTLLDRPDRTREQDDEMLHAAHASRHHWAAVGTAAHLARGEWQCSRVYSVLGRPEPALHHAQRCLDLCVENGIADWDLAFAYEALARAHRVAGNREEFERNLELARDAGTRIAEDEDRQLLEQNLAELAEA